MMAGVDMVHVPYRGAAPALTDLLGGQVQVMFGAMSASIEYIRAGKLRALAVTTATRSEALPDIPTVGEFVPGYEASDWYGIGAPKNTPAEIIDKLNKEINAGLADPKMKARLADLGGTVLAGSPADFGKLIADETEKWGKVIRAVSIKPRSASRTTPCCTAPCFFDPRPDWVNCSRQTMSATAAAFAESGHGILTGMSTRPRSQAGDPMTLGNMRANGVRSLDVCCWQCGRQALAG